MNKVLYLFGKLQKYRKVGWWNVEYKNLKIKNANKQGQRD